MTTSLHTCSVKVVRFRREFQSFMEAETPNTWGTALNWVSFSSLWDRFGLKSTLSPFPVKTDSDHFRMSYTWPVILRWTKTVVRQMKSQRMLTKCPVCSHGAALHSTDCWTNDVFNFTNLSSLLHHNSILSMRMCLLHQETVKKLVFVYFE